MFVVAQQRHGTLSRVLEALQEHFYPAVPIRGGFRWEPKEGVYADTVCYLRHGFLYQDSRGEGLKRKSTLEKKADGSGATSEQLGEFYVLALTGREDK